MPPLGSEPDGEFVWDDDAYVENNRTLRSLHGLLKIWTDPGATPQYYPAVFSYADYSRDSDRLVDSLWYAHIRSLFEDVKILIKSLLYRFFRAGSQ